MWRNGSKNILKAIAGFIDLSFVLQYLVTPILFLTSYQAVQAAVAPTIDATYNAESHEFTITAEPVVSAEFTLAYTTAEGVTQGFTGSGAADNNVFRGTGIADTESNGVYTYDEVVDGTLDLTATLEGGEEYEYSSAFTIENGALVLENTPASNASEPTWTDNGDGSFTWERVELNQTLVAPQNDKVTLTFTSLPEKSDSITIREVTLTDEQVAELGALTNTAYDITSTMEDGTFTYDLTLPNPAPEKEVEVKFSEDGNTFEDASGEEKRDDVVTIQGLDHFTVFVVTYNSVPDPMPGAFPSLGFAATSTQELGDHILLDGTARDLSSITLGLTNWSCENDFAYNSGTGEWEDTRANDEACVTTPGSSFEHPITLNIYEVDKSGSDPAVGSLITTKTINADIPFRPSWDSVNCTESGETPDTNQPFGGKWYDPELDKCTNGYAFNISYDFSADGITLPNEVIISTAYNTQTHGYAPIGKQGPYNSLNVSLTESDPSIGTNVDPDDLFWNTKNASWYTDGGAGGVATFRRDTGWSPYALVLSAEMAQNEAPVVTIEDPTPTENSYVRGTITGHAIANDDIGMGSYYLRFWQDAFGVGAGGTLRGNCQAAPGGSNLGTTQDVTCDYDTTQFADGKYVFSAQFLDSDIKWGQATREFFIDNTAPTMSNIKMFVNGTEAWSAKAGDTIRIEADAQDTFSGMDRVQIWVRDWPYTGQQITSGNMTYVSGDTYSFEFVLPDTYTNSVTLNESDAGNYFNFLPWDNAGNSVIGYRHNFTADLTAPSAPVLLSPVDGFGLDSSELPLSQTWESVADAVLYEYQSCYDDPSDDGITNCSSPAYSTQLTATQRQVGPQSDVIFWWRVRAQDAVGNWSPWSESRQIIVDSEAPAAPQFTFPTNEQYFKNQPILNQWNEVTDASGIDFYRVEYVYDDEHTFSGGPNREVDGMYTSRNHVPATWKQGGVTVRVQAVDMAGNESEWSQPVHYYYDISVPLSTFQTPEENSITNNSIAITGTSTDRHTSEGSFDGAYVDFVELFYQEDGDDSWTLITQLDNTGPSEPFNWNYDWTPASDGIYNLKVTATDKAGNVESTDYVYGVTFDTTEPSTPANITIFDHNGVDLQCNGATNNRSITVDWDDVSDPDLAYYQYDIKDKDNHKQPTDSFYINTIRDEDGEYMFRARAVDTAGNKSEPTEWCNVTLDRAIPEVILDEAFPATSDSEAGFTNDKTPEFTGAATDSTSTGVAAVDYRISGDTTIDWTPVDTLNGAEGDLSRTFSFITSTLADGSYTVHVRSMDRAGNTSSEASYSFVVDTTAPVTEITAPTDGSPVSGTITVDATITDANQMRYFFAIDEVGGGRIFDLTVPYAPVLSYILDTTTLDDGEYTLRVSALDKAGNRTSVSTDEITILVDNTFPTSTITGPGESTDSATLIVNNWDGTVTGTANDSGSGLERVELSLQRGSDNLFWDGTNWVSGSETSTRVPATGTDTWSFDLGFSPAQDTYTVISHAVDLAGNVENSAKLVIILDKTIPEVDISVDPTDPDGNNNWYVTRPTVTLTASDDGGADVDEIQYQWNSDSGTWTTYTGSFQIPGEGSYVLYYRALDNANNPSDTGVKNLKWDETQLDDDTDFGVSASPNPTSGTTTTLTWDAAEDNTGITEYQITWKLRDSSTQYGKTVGGDVLSTEIDRLEEGIWEVTVKAVDGVGNFREASTTVTVDRTAPAAPTLNLDGTGDGSVTLSWNAVDGANDYIVYYGTTAGEYIYAARVGNVTSTTVQGLTAGTYFFVVRAVDSVNNQSPNSNEVNSGAIAGAAGATGGPAAGFAPAGEVLGATDDTQTEETNQEGEIASGETEENSFLGNVLGASTENCSVPGWWWSIIAIYLVALLLIHAIFEGHARTIAHLLAAVATAAALFTVLCMPWFWMAIVLILAGTSEAMPWLMSPSKNDPFAKSFKK